jgi:hypothetical protein
MNTRTVTPHRLINGGALALLLALPVAGRAQENPAPAAPKPPVVATVNGKDLTEPEFHKRCERVVGGQNDTSAGFVALREWIQQTLAEEEAKKKNLLPSSQDVERRVKALRKQWEFRGENFEEWLTIRGRTLMTLREEVRNQLIAENLLTEGVSISDVEVATYYAGNKQLFGLPERLEVSRITVEQRDAAREVEAALKRGDAFADLARKRSVDTFAQKGGKLPVPVSTDPKADGGLEKEVQAKVAGLETGKWAGPVKVEDYWVFVRVDQKLPAKAPELPDIQDLLAASLKVQKGGPERLKTAQARIDQLQKDAKIEVFRPEYQHLVKLLQPKD